MDSQFEIVTYSKDTIYYTKNSFMSEIYTHKTNMFNVTSVNELFQRFRNNKCHVLIVNNTDGWAKSIENFLSVIAASFCESIIIIGERMGDNLSNCMYCKAINDLSALKTYIESLYCKVVRDANNIMLMPEMGARIADDLISIGILPNHRGFHYLTEIILVSVFSDGKLRRLHTELYPVITAKYNVKAASVERCIRFSITYAMERLNYNSIKEKTDPILRAVLTSPTNSSIVSALVGKYLIEKGQLGTITPNNK
ncbi:MAG: sporulation initiation factor Spo0A C-terminal domain-containing protein [Clostridia bacterium]